MKKYDNVKVLLKDNERQAVECWTRVMGYFRPYSQFNKGKKSEFNERKWFVEERCSCTVQRVEKAA